MSINSKIKVDSVESYDPPSQPIELVQGATVPSGKTMTINGNASVTGTVSAGTLSGTDINASGAITANAFVGDSTNITALPVIAFGKAVAHTFIL